MKTLNRRFNRLESKHGHLYLVDYSTEPLGDHEYEGLIKCKLIHTLGASVILPDQIYLGREANTWIQPLAFLPCVLAKYEEDQVRAGILIDISCGQTIRVEFEHRDLLKKGADGSELFRCTIKGPPQLEDFATGTSRIGDNGFPELLLYHHTSDRVKPLILESGHLRGSNWNIQGNKELENVQYVYFTCLDRITAHEDLVQIAMASNGTILLVRDNAEVPRLLNKENWQPEFDNDILRLEVYREDTSNRTATIELFVNSEDLASQHLLFHQPHLAAHFYEICKPFIYRVGLDPGHVLPIDPQKRTAGSGATKHFTHIVAGDATSVTGLSAPYDEENTDDIFKIETTPDPHSMLTYWFEVGNQERFTHRAFEPFEFKQKQTDSDN